MNETQAQAQATRPQQLPIGQVLAILWRGRWIILVTALLCLTLGVLYVNNRGTIRRASSRLYVERQGMTIPGVEMLMAAGGRNRANTQAEVLHSSKVLSDALRSPDLRGTTLFEKVESPIAWLKKEIDVSVGRDNDIITVSLDSTKIEEACRLVNAIVDAYIAFHSTKNRSSTDATLKKLKAQLTTHQDALRDGQKQKKELLSENPELGRAGTGDFEYALLRELNTALAQAELRESDARKSANEAKELSREPKMLRSILRLKRGLSDEVVEDNARKELRQQLRDLDARRLELLVQVRPEHRSVQLLNAAKADLGAQLDELDREETQSDKRFAELYVAYLDREQKAAAHDVADLKTRVRKQEKQYQGLGSKRADYFDLDAELTRLQNTIDFLTKGINQISLAQVDEKQDKDLLSIQVLGYANPKTAVVTSSYARVIATFLFLGLVLGFGLAWLRGIFDQRLRNADEVGEALDVPILGTMPRTASVTTEVEATQSWDEHSALAESARSLRTAVYFGLPEGMGRIIHITSPESGDGKSMVSSKLAIAMAKAGQKTLILDADLRRPTQAKLFQIENQDEGLANVLATETALKKAIQTTRLENLDILTSGPVPANPAEILNSQKFGELLQQLAERYDRIIVDSPPLLPVADARIIATKCDTSILVLRVDKSTRKRTTAARDCIRSVGATILGCVLNDMPSGIGYGYGGYYGGRYSYGYGGYGDDQTAGKRRRRSTKSASKSETKSASKRNPAQPEERV